jgi:hypothetical protein
MKTLALLGLGLMLCSACVFAGEYLMNDTGEAVTGLCVVFSEPVRITSFGDVLLSVDPLGVSIEFVFSGAELEAWGGHWLNWEPASARIMSYEWLSDFFAAMTPALPSGLSDEVNSIVYGYLDMPRRCSGVGEFRIPVYVSVPLNTPIDDVFALRSAGGSVGLHRVDEVTLVGEVIAEAIPVLRSFELIRNGNRMMSFEIALENGYQAITLGITELEGVESYAPFPDDFVTGAAITDVWGSFLYGGRGEGAVHHRHYFAPTCQRLSEDGFRDVYLTSTFHFVQVDPVPRLAINAETMGIEEADFRVLVATAHEYGLRFHLMYNAAPARDEDFAILTQSPKSISWLRTFFEEYETLMVEQARMAERCGVDAFMLNWQAAGIDYGSHVEEWYTLWTSTIAAVRRVFTGQLEYNICRWRMAADLGEGCLSPEVFDGVDSFVFSQWVPDLRTSNDSIVVLYEYFAEWLFSLERLRSAVGRPVVLELNLQSTDGYLTDGWFDVAIGIVGNSTPDFFEQARACEALFQAIVRTDVADGVILYKYNWDDPFGPDLGAKALSRMDLSGSIRNKPAEAVVKRWLGGTPGPSLMISQQQSDVMNRPWCPALSKHEIRISQCALLMDDFEGSPSFRDAGWSIDYDSAYRQRPDMDPTSYCHLTFAEDSRGNTHLVADFKHDSWVKTRYWGESMDMSSYDGIELTLWADDTWEVIVELGTQDPTAGWQAGLSSGISVDRAPRRFHLPFSDFKNPTNREEGILPYLRALVEVNVLLMRGLNRSNALEGTLFLDDICFYKE